jgi:hypothetical protein
MCAHRPVHASVCMRDTLSGVLNAGPPALCIKVNDSSWKPPNAVPTLTSERLQLGAQGATLRLSAHLQLNERRTVSGEQ